VIIDQITDNIEVIVCESLLYRKNSMPFV